MSALSQRNAFADPSGITPLRFSPYGSPSPARSTSRSARADLAVYRGRSVADGGDAALDRVLDRLGFGAICAG
ncbi:MAG: hypothetical protein ACR2F9_08340 [Longimicrobiaceae bacterium]